MKPVDVIIACHNPNRPIGRAVRSVVEGNSDVARTVVVCHNVARTEVEAVIPPDIRHRVTYLECHDGIYSPSGPFMYGIDHSKATWVSIMGSDDQLQPGAIQALLDLSEGVDMVAIRSSRGGRTVPTPPVRVFPRKVRSIVKDRLLYRSAPLGIMNREFLAAHDIRLTPGFTNGGDIDFTLRLWQKARVAVQRRGPGYVVNEDATDRVTMRLARAEDEMKHCQLVWVDHLPDDPHVRQALAFKYLRIHFFSFALMRAQHGWADGDRKVIKEWVDKILSYAPLTTKVLSRADVALIRALQDLSVPIETVNEAAFARRRFGRLNTLLSQDLRYVFHREAPVRFSVASVVTKYLS